jgi:hypothetical protein
MTESILTTIKKMLGISEDDTSFDVDIIVHINTAFMTLTQLGVGPEVGFSITDTTKKWSDFLGSLTTIEGVKTYVYLKVRLVFDPPSTSFVIDAIKNQIAELEWRLMVEVEPPPATTTTEEVIL